MQNREFLGPINPWHPLVKRRFFQYQLLTVLEKASGAAFVQTSFLFSSVPAGKLFALANPKSAGGKSLHVRKCHASYFLFFFFSFFPSLFLENFFGLFLSDANEGRICGCPINAVTS